MQGRRGTGLVGHGRTKALANDDVDRVRPRGFSRHGSVRRRLWDLAALLLRVVRVLATQAPGTAKEERVRQLPKRAGERNAEPRKSNWS